MAKRGKLKTNPNNVGNSKKKNNNAKPKADNLKTSRTKPSSFKPDKNKVQKQYASFQKSSVKPKTSKPKKTDWKAAAKKGLNTTALGTKQKKTETKIGKKTKLKTVNALSRNDFLLLENASRLPNAKLGNKSLEGNKKGLAKKIGSKTAESAYKSKAATGVMQGMSKVDVFSGVGEYNKAAKKAIKKTKKSTAYNVGYGVGMAADMAIGGVGSKGEALASASIKQLTKKGAKEGAKQIAKKSAKKSAEKSVKESAKAFAKRGAGELVAETPTNVLDAAKMSLDENGKVDKKEFGKWMAVNTAMTSGFGRGIDAIGGAVAKKQVKKATELLALKKAGKITAEQEKELAKISKSLTKKSSRDGGSLAKDIAGRGKKSIRDEANSIKWSEKAAKTKGFTEEQLKKERRDAYYKRIEELKKEKSQKKADADKYQEGISKGFDKAEDLKKTAEWKKAEQDRLKSGELAGEIGDKARSKQNGVDNLTRAEERLEKAQAEKKNAGTLEGYQKATNEEARAKADLETARDMNANSTSVKRLQNKIAEIDNEIARATEEKVPTTAERMSKLRATKEELSKTLRAEQKKEIERLSKERRLKENGEVSAPKTESDTITPKAEEKADIMAKTGSNEGRASGNPYRKSKTQNLKDEYAHMSDDELRAAIKEEKKQGKGKWKHGANINAKAGPTRDGFPEGRRLQGEATEHFDRAEAMEYELKERNLSEAEIKQRENKLLLNELDKVNSEIKSKESFVESGEDEFFDLSKLKEKAKEDLKKLKAKRDDIVSKLGAEGKNEGRIAEIDKELKAINEERVKPIGKEKLDELNLKAKSLKQEKEDIIKGSETPNAEKPSVKNPAPEGSYTALKDDPAFPVDNSPNPKKIEIDSSNPYKSFKEGRNPEGKAPTETPREKEQRAKVKKEKTESDSLFQKFYNQFVSTLAPLEKIMMQGSSEGDRLLGRAKVNKMLTARAKARTMIEKKGASIFTRYGLEKSPEKMAAFDDYCVLKHDLDRIKKEAANYIDKDGAMHTFRFENPKGTKGYEKELGKLKAEIEANGIQGDVRFSNMGATGLTKEEIESVLKDIKKQYGKEVEEFQDRLSKYHFALLKEDFNAGIISKETFERLQKDYPHYVPTYREVDEFVRVAPQESIGVGRLYNLAGGGDKPILSQYTQMVAKTNKVMKRAAENDMANVLAKINGVNVKDLPRGRTPAEILEVSSGTYTTKNGDYRLFYYENGKGKSVDISEDCYHAIRRWSNEEKAAILEYKLVDKTLNNKGVETVGRGFKAWITDYSLIFGSRNFIRDNATSLLYSKHPVQWFAAYPKTIKAFLGKDKTYKAIFDAYKENGGRYSNLVTSTSLDKAAKLDAKDGIPGLRYIKEFNSVLETIPRMNEFIASIERGAKKYGGDIEKALKDKDIIDTAMYEAKEVTLNFDRSGQVGAAINRGAVPFFNPAIQGADKLARFLVTDNKSPKEFMNMAMKVGGLVAMPTVVFETIVGGDEDYQKLSAYNKYTYFCIPLGKDENGDPQFLKIPRARELSSLQTPIDWFCQNVIYQNRDGSANLFKSGVQAGKIAIEQSGPVNPVTDNLASPLLNLVRNKTWYGGSLEGWEDEEKRRNKDVNDIYDSDTSSAAVTIQTLINNAENKTLDKLGIGKDTQTWIKRHQISPKQLDMMFDSYLGVMYDVGLKPFSQSGANVKDSLKNKKETLKALTLNPFTTAYVLNGTLSNTRRSKMYADLSSLEDKLKNENEGSPKYNEIQAKITKLNNGIVYDSKTYDSAIDYVNSSKMTPAQKKEVTMQLKRMQNNAIDRYNGGKLHGDPLKKLLNLKDSKGKKVFTTDEVLQNFTFTDKDGNNSVADSWEQYKKTSSYKKNGEKDFLDVTFATRKIANRTGESKGFVDYQSAAIVCVDKANTTGKDYSDILDSYHISKSKRTRAEAYINEMGGTMDTYIASHKHVVKAAQELGIYTSKFKDHDFAMALAQARTGKGNKLKDRAYFIEGDTSRYNAKVSYVYQRMNYARCLTDEKYADSKWGMKKVHKFATKYDLDYYSEDEKIVNAINEKYPGKTNEEKAALFGVIKPTDKNPFGEVGDYSVNGDTGISSGGRGHGRGGRRRGHGGGGRGGSSSFTPEVYKASGGRSKKLSDVTFDSTLNEAYRRQLKKRIKDMNKSTK